MAKILFVVTEDWYFCSHRLPIAIAAKENGYDVTVVTQVNKHAELIRSYGLHLIPIKVSRSSINPIKELLLIKKIISIYKKEKPNIVHHVAIKPVIYGSIALLFTQSQSAINAIAGLGHIYSSENIREKIIKAIINFAFVILLNRKNSMVIVQNSDDLSLLCNKKIVKQTNIHLIRGAGVDTEEFKNIKSITTDNEFIVLLASRMIWPKGIKEFISAAVETKKRGYKIKFVLAGNVDIDNSSCVPKTQLDLWHKQEIIEWRGHVDNMCTTFSSSSIVCLPSYYAEGIPKVLIEAASCEKPIITTDMPGCREIVKNHVNGIIIPPKDSLSLAEAIIYLFENDAIRSKMGQAGREIVKKHFSLNHVINQHLNLYEQSMINSH